MLNRPKNVNKGLNKIPKVLISHISKYLSYYDACKFASVSKYSLFFRPQEIDNREDYPDFLKNKARSFNAVLQIALMGIGNYLNLHAKKPEVLPDLGGYSVTANSINYSKGYRRAMCFWDILSDEQNTYRERFFALNVLLRESNGNKLKKSVLNQLYCYEPHYTPHWLNLYVRYQFGDKFEKMEKALLEIIHDNENGPMPDRVGYEDDFDIGFTRQHFRNVIENQYEIKPSKQCVVS